MSPLASLSRLRPPAFAAKAASARRDRRLWALSSALCAALTPEQVSLVAVRRGAAVLGGSAAVVLLATADGTALEALACTGFDRAARAALARLPVAAALPFCDVFRAGEPAWMGEGAALALGPRSGRGGQSASSLPDGLMGLPLSVGGRTIGVLGLGFRAARAPGAPDRALALTVARRCAEALDRARRHARERQANERLRLLADAGDMLASSLDFETTLRGVAMAAIPLLGDICVFDVREGERARRVAAGLPGAEGGLVPLDEPTADEARLLDAPRVVLLPRTTTDELERAGLGEPTRALLGRLGCRSLLSVPFVAHGRPLGVMTLLHAASGRSHDQDDVTLAEALSSRAALALDNARLYSEAQNANRLKDEFLSIVSHELRTPLTAILGWAQILGDGKARDEAMLSRGLSAIERNAKAQAQIVEDILDVARIVTGKLRLELRPVDLVVVIRAALEVVRPAVQAKSLLVDVINDDPVGVVLGDKDRLQQVVWNLLSNAAKFTPNGGRVTVRVERRGSFVSIEVRDSGTGISPEFLPHVFERFRQADSSVTRGKGGLGLGLAIVQHLVELHGGSIAVESPGLGQGSIFTVRLPLPASPPDDAPPDGGRGAAEAAAATPRLDGLSLLVVDDEADARDMLAIILRRQGADVALAGSAAEALIMLRRQLFDVLISDVGMPVEDGFTLLRNVRALPGPESRVPAVALTGYASPDDARRSLLAGFQIHVAKPVGSAMLVAVVAELGGRGGRPAARSCD